MVNETMSTAEKLAARITTYLACGGLVNPELANHEAVRNLLIECREAITGRVSTHGHGASKPDLRGVDVFDAGEIRGFVARGALRASDELLLLRDLPTVIERAQPAADGGRVYQHDQAEEIACVRQALPEEWRDSVPSVAVATLVAELDLLRKTTATAADGAQRVERMSEEQIDDLWNKALRTGKGPMATYLAAREFAVLLAASWGVKLDGDAS